VIEELLTENRSTFQTASLQQNAPVTLHALAKPTTSELSESIAIIGTDGITDSELEARIFVITNDSMLSRRLIDWLPEIFGLVLISHMANVTLPRTFSAKTRRGQWIELDLKLEPIFEPALVLAQQMYHDGPNKIFKCIAIRSAVVSAANRALNSGHDLDGATLSGPALVGIPAEWYIGPSMSLWKRLFWRRPH
jgi:hypothetical protein